MDTSFFAFHGYFEGFIDNIVKLVGVFDAVIEFCNRFCNIGSWGFLEGVKAHGCCCYLARKYNQGSTVRVGIQHRSYQISDPWATGDDTNTGFVTTFGISYRSQASTLFVCIYIVIYVWLVVEMVN